MLPAAFIRGLFKGILKRRICNFLRFRLYQELCFPWSPAIPIAVVASWFIIEGLKLKESAWPKMVARIGLVAGVLFYLTL